MADPRPAEQGEDGSTSAHALGYRDAVCPEVADELDSESRSAASRGRDLTVGSVPRHLLVFSVPMLAQSAVQNAYAIVNGIWVGRGLGTDALAAITAGFPVFFMLVAAAMGLTMATNILVAQAYGARDWDRVRHVVRNSVTLIALVGIGTLIVGELLAAPILVAMETPGHVLRLASSYLHIYLLTTPLNFGLFLLAACLRGAGDSKTPVWFQLGALVLNTVLDPLLMFGWLGFPRLGLNGTAWASITSMSAAFIGLALYLHRTRHLVAPAWRRLGLSRSMTWLTLSIGVPSMIQQAMVSVGAAVTVGLVNRFGEDAAAAFGAVVRVEQMALLPALTIGMAIASLAGQNIGARRFDRVREVLRWGVLLSGGFTLFVSLLAAVVPRPLVLMFTGEPDVVELGVGYLRTVSPAYVCFAVMFAANGVVNGAGRTFATTLFTLISIWLVRVPVATVLSARMDSVRGIWLGIVAGLVVGMLVSLGYYHSGRWRRPVVTRPFQKPAEARPDSPA
ncbi:MAG TPA: MATE family efflux transporter [Armatimonadota bacterium]|nr:MATE family efflux transporter [Armatimonadota bacterium]